MDIEDLRKKFIGWKFEGTNDKFPYRLVIDNYNFNCQIFEFIDYEILEQFYKTLNYLMKFLNDNGFIRFEYNGDVRQDVFEFINEEHDIFVSFDLYDYEIPSCDYDVEFTIESFIEEIKDMMLR